jgi:hypothetical protein
VTGAAGDPGRDEHAGKREQRQRGEPGGEEREGRDGDRVRADAVR